MYVCTAGVAVPGPSDPHVRGNRAFSWYAFAALAAMVFPCCSDLHLERPFDVEERTFLSAACAAFSVSISVPSRCVTMNAAARSGFFCTIASKAFLPGPERWRWRRIQLPEACT